MRAYGFGTGKVGITLGLLGILHVFSPLGGHLADKWQMREPCGRLKFILVISIPVFFCGVAAWTTVGIIPFKFWIVIHSLLITLSSFMQPVVVTIVQDVKPVPVRATAIATTLFLPKFSAASWVLWPSGGYLMPWVEGPGD
jgi:MFS family permease